MAQRLNVKDSISEWITKINAVLDLQNVDGAFVNNDTSWSGTTFTLSGGKVRSGTNILDVPGASLTLPVASVSIVGVNVSSGLLEDYLDGNVPASDFIPLYIVTTNNTRIISLEDARTWAYEDSGAAAGEVAVHEAKPDPHSQYYKDGDDISAGSVDTATGTQTLDVALDERIIWVNTIADLQALPTSELVDGQIIILTGWHPGSAQGGGELYYDASRAKSDHNGGTVFSPTVPWTTTTSDYLDATGETDASGTGVFVRKENDVRLVTHFGAVGDGVTDDYASFAKAIASANISSSTLVIPVSETNEWAISQTLDIRKKLWLIGKGSHGTGTEVGTVLKFPADVAGIVVNGPNTSLYTTITPDPDFPGAVGTLIESIHLRGGGGTASQDGVVIRAGCQLNKVTARNFPRYGFRIHADIGAGGSIEGNANGWTLSNCQAVSNGSHGLYTDGNDANVGYAEKFYANSNGGYGIYENSLIGNSYVAPDTTGNATGSIWANRTGGATTIIGAWEDGVGSSVFNIGVTSIGGNGGQPTDASIGFHQTKGVASNAPYRHQNKRVTPRISARVGSESDKPIALSWGTALESPNEDAWKLLHSPDDDAWIVQYANSTSFQPIAYFTGSSLLWSERKFSGPVFKNGYGVVSSGTYGASTRIRKLGSAAPTTDTYYKGDIVYNMNPDPGEYIGWVCVTAGTPGTWKGFGLIET